MPVSLEALPENLRLRVGPTAPAPLRMMIARALVPMGPEDLFSALAYLSSNEEGDLGATALQSLSEMPVAVVGGLIGGITRPDLLDFAIRRYVEDEPIAERILLNAQTPDDAVEWAARRVRGRLIEIIGNNQERFCRHAPIVEAIYYNPEAPMAVVGRVFETAVRSGLNLHHIPGFKEIYESIFGREAVRKAEERAVGARQEEPQQPEPVEEEQQTFYDEREALNILIEDLPDELPDMGVGLEDDDYLQALLAASTDDEEGGDEEEQLSQKPLYKMISEMNIPQKVRMALMGNKAARAILIKDAKTVVALSVLKSTGLRIEEVALFARDKMISDRVVSEICRNRKWVRNPDIQKSLLKHPKTPPAFTNRWVRVLQDRDLAALSKSRDIPGHVSRLARNVLAQRVALKEKQMKKGKGK